LEDLLQRGYRYALSLTHDRHRAEDLVQEACASLLRSGGHWRVASLFTAIRHRLIDQLRRKELTMQSLESGLEGALEAYAATVWADEPDEELGRALSILRPDERELLFLSVIEEMSAAEIAEMTRRPRGTILSLLHRAKHKLRQFLPGLRQR
jgi:RNA polymerase sigma-70 factor (ECF subfamily)